MNRRYEAHEKRMLEYMKTFHELIANFEAFEIVQVPREENNHADALANLGLASRTVIKRVNRFAYLDEPSLEASKLKKSDKCRRTK